MFENALYQTSQLSTDKVKAEFDAANAQMDKVLANPKSTLTQLNKATDRLAAATLNYLNRPSTVTATPPSSEQPTYSTPTTQEGGYSGGGYLTATPPVQEQPVVPFVAPVKTAPIDTILFNNDEVPIDVMTDLIFENIGGIELINISRNDTINGQTVIYQPIKNLTSIQQKYNPNNILSIQNTSDKFFAGFSIKLDEKIPNVANGANGENVYLNESTGDIIIELVNMYEGDQVETQISTTGTIYEADI